MFESLLRKAHKAHKEYAQMIQYAKISNIQHTCVTAALYILYNDHFLLRIESHVLTHPFLHLLPQIFLLQLHMVKAR